MDELVGRTFHAVFVPLSSSTLLIYHLFRHCERWPHFDGGENKACTMRRVDGTLHGATLKGAKIWGDVAGIDTFLKWIVARVQQVWVCYSLQKRKRPSTCFPHPCVRGWGETDSFLFLDVRKRRGAVGCLIKHSTITSQTGALRCHPDRGDKNGPKSSSSLTLVAQ